MRYAAIVLSRQPLRPTGRTAWVRESVEAVQWLRDNDLGLISSVGLQTWELVTALASDLSVPLRLVIPCSSSEEFFRESDRARLDFDLSEGVEFLAAQATADSARESPSTLRDRLVMESADLLLPISCRPGGNMGALVDEARGAGKEIDERFAVGVERPSATLKFDLGNLPLNPSLQKAGQQYLIHWTRSSNVQWPGEKKADLYRDITRSDRWPRSGLDTLRRIVRMKKIIASPRHMPERTPTVSLSGLTPIEAAPLMQWRARYRQMAFEPYGIGVRRSLADQLGIEEVQYFDLGNEADISAAERWKWQSSGKITAWRREHECRCLGDLDLSAVHTDDLALFCRTAEEARQLGMIHSSPVWSFLG